MIKPTNYSQWVEIFDILKSRTDDDEVLKAMQDGSIVWQAGVAERFAKQLTDSINERMNFATDKFQTDMSRCKNEERLIVQALIALRKEMQFLLKLVDIQVLPENDRSNYKGLIINRIEEIQQSLEDSAKSDRTGKLSSIIRNNKINIKMEV